MPVPRRRLPLLLSGLFAVLTLVSSCGLLGSDDRSSAGQSQGGPTEIKISVLPTTDLAPFYLALKNGYFTDANLKIDGKKDVIVAKSSEDSTNKLNSGEVDIAYSAYPPLFLDQAKGNATGRGGIKLIADASSAGPGSCVVVALPDSSVKSVQDMAGKRVAVTSESSISAFMIKSVLKTSGIDWHTIHWVPTAFPQTSIALNRRDVDAAFATEPWISDAFKNASATPVFDTATGPTLNMATAGFGSTGNFVKQNKDAVTAFQKVMLRATNEAKQDRSKVEQLLTEFAKVDTDTAKLSTLLTFQSSLDPSRIQRVPDLMQEFDALETRLDVATMIVATPQQ